MERILLPMLALTGWTFLVLLQIPFRRFRAGFRGQVTAADFRYGESERVPPEVSIPNRNLMNLLEMPVVFYALTLVLLVTRRVDQTALVLAWVYVGLRVAHSLVHLSYNRVRDRLTLYAVSNVVLVMMWARLVLKVINGSPLA
jgi:hypothetical protein